MLGENLWGDLSDLEIVRTPKSIVQEQADYLTEATKGDLQGETFERHAGQTFGFDLDVVVPSLNNYRYTLLMINHGMDLCPVTVIISPGAGKESDVCENESEFVALVQAVLSSKEVRTRLSKLLSQIR